MDITLIGQSERWKPLDSPFQIHVVIMSLNKHVCYVMLC